MGSFSVWHWLMGGPLLLLVIAVGVVIYLVIRKRPQTSSETSILVTASTVATTQTTARSTTQKVISIAYLIGGAFGAITILPQLNGTSLGLLDAFASLIILAQIAAALYGGWQFWNHKPIGAQVLYWLSWSCVPVLSFPVLSYWCAMGLAVFPTVALGSGHFSTDFSLRFGYASQLWFNPNESGLLVGANLVAIAFVIMLSKALKTAGVPRWPLVSQNA